MEEAGDVSILCSWSSSSLLAPETLESLLETSRTPEGRSFLASRDLVPELLLLLSSHSHRIPLLRLLRNLCAGDSTNQLSFIRSSGSSIVTSILAISAPTEVVRVALQLLANVAAAGEDHSSAVWVELLHGGFLLEILRIADRVVLDAICMILYTCCFAAATVGAARRRQELCGGVEIVASVVREAIGVGYQGTWLQLLLSRLCFEEIFFQKLFLELGFHSTSENSAQSEFSEANYTECQAFLLEFLSEILQGQHYSGAICSEFALNILHVLQNVSLVVDFSTRGSHSLPTGCPATDTLGFSLLILRDLCALDSSSFPTIENHVNLLLSSGICQFLLNLLRDLEPPEIIKKSILCGEKQGLPSLTVESLKYCPYTGFRRDIVSVLGNCMFGRKDVQDEVRRQNGVFLLLQQCVIDEQNPFLREWGIWAVRCLLDRNPENQKQVADLEIQGLVETPESAKLGLRVEIDQISHRARLVNMSDSNAVSN